MNEPASSRPRGRRWPSYSLRSLFVFITIIAIGAAWVAMERRQSQYELEIAEQLKARGVQVEFARLFSDDLQRSIERSHNALRSILGPRVRHVESHGDHSLTDLSLLAGLKSLEVLNLNHSKVTNLAPLAELKNLVELNLDGTQVSDLAPLAGLINLQILFLDGTQVSDLAPLAGLKNLKVLTLDHTEVSDLASLAGLRNLTELNINCTQVSDLAPLAGAKNLRELNLFGTQVNDLMPLAGVKTLAWLNLGGTFVSDRSPAGLKIIRMILDDMQISEEQVKLLQRSLPNCKIDR